MTALKYVQAGTLYQAGAGSIIGATTIVLTSFADIYGNVLTMTDFGGKGYGTMEPDTNNEESFTFTGVTANANGTYSLTGVSTALAKSPYTETSGTIRQHSGGTKVVVSDTTAFWNTFANKNNQNTFTDTQTFSVTPSSPVDPVNNTDVANKEYVDAVAIAGAPNANTTTKGIVQIPTQAQVDAGTATGSTGASLTPTPALLRSKLLSDYVVDTGSANAYVITPAPAISAYATGQIFSFKAVNANTTVSTINVNALGTKTIKKLNGTADLVKGDIVAGQIVLIEYDGTNFQMLNPSAASASVKFGGTGADGAFSATSGATNIDLGSASYVEKNYTSISITGTGSMTFTNPNANGTVVVLRSQGNVTLTSSTAPMIVGTGLGSTGGAGGAAASNPGTIGTDTFGTLISRISGGSPGTGGSAGAGGAVPTVSNGPVVLISSSLGGRSIRLSPGSGGGGGGSTGATADLGGAGGRGGGALYIECGGAWNFTTSGGISVAGSVGTAGANAQTKGGGGGGGGAGGMFIALYNTLTANSGTVVVNGGTGGAGGGAATGGAGGNGSAGTGFGGAGAAGISSGSGGGAGGNQDAGTSNGSTGGSGTGGGGGGGASGVSFIALNTYFA